jgi:peptidoglycan/xylan/chitin deacetylase (PgdA/CDA1 family)
MKGIEKALAFGFKVSGIPGLLMGLKKNSLTILAYHHIYNEDLFDEQEIVNPFFVGMDTFLEQLRFVKEKYTLVGVREVSAWLAGEEELGDHPLLLTFDDGYRKFYENVYPELAAMNIPALVNVITGWVDGEVTPWDVLINRCVNRSMTNRLVLAWNGEEMVLSLDSREKRRNAFVALSDRYISSRHNDRERLLGSLVKAAPWIVEEDEVLESLRWDEIREMTGDTHSHAVLSGMNEAEVREEILRAMKRLEDELPNPAAILAYPAGQYDSTAMAQASDLNFHFALRADGGLVGKGEDPVSLPRICISGEDTMSQFVFRSSGLRSMLSGTGRKRRTTSN